MWEAIKLYWRVSSFILGILFMRNQLMHLKDSGGKNSYQAFWGWALLEKK